VSIAVIKIEFGELSTSGILLKGRVRKLVHRPDSCSSARTASASMSSTAVPV
jgi:hypothetical protein